MKALFCPNCGAEGQSVESYCRHCGKWLPDIDSLTNVRLFRKSTREQKIGKVRILEMVSAGLSLTSALIIISILAGGDMKILFLAAFCSIIVTFYQVINFYLGYKIHKGAERRTEQGEPRIETIAEKSAGALKAADTTDFGDRPSITENTTKHLDPVLREKNK